MLKDLQRNLNKHHLLCLCGIIFIIAAINVYSNTKSSYSEGASSRLPVSSGQSATSVSTSAPPTVQGGGVQPADPAGSNDIYTQVSGGNSTVSNCNSKAISDPKDLLPADANSQWAQLNPVSSSDMGQVNLLSAGQLAGINTVGSSMRNSNLQIRAEPPNPTTSVSPWQQSTISPGNGTGI